MIARAYVRRCVAGLLLALRSACESAREGARDGLRRARVAIRVASSRFRALAARARRRRSSAVRASAAMDDADSDADADAGVADYGVERYDDPERHDPLRDRLLPALGLASRESRHSVIVTFLNACGERCRLYWIDYAGKVVRYKTLSPGETHRQQTFETHPWTFATVPDDDAVASGGGFRRRRLAVNGYPVYFASRERDGDGDGDGETTGAGDSTRRITRPGCKAWRHDAHREFPRFFRDVSRAFLMTHARLRRERAAAAAEGEGGDAGDVVRVSVVNDAAMDVEDAPVSSRTRARTRVSSAPAEAATVSSASGDEDDDEDDDDDRGGDPASKRAKKNVFDFDGEERLGEGRGDVRGAPGRVADRRGDKGGDAPPRRAADLEVLPVGRRRRVRRGRRGHSSVGSVGVEPRDGRRRRRRASAAGGAVEETGDANRRRRRRGRWRRL